MTNRIIGHCCLCGRDRVVHSRYGGIFCGTCFYDLPQVPCDQCAQLLRAPAAVTRPLCRKCRNDSEWTGVVCAHCGRVPQKNRRVTLKDGRQCCTNCKPMLMPPKQCSYCGQLAHRVYRVYSLGLTEPACPTCVGKQNSFPNCAACHRPRKLAGMKHGKPYCAACYPEQRPPQITCSVCNQLRSAYTKTTCEDCSWEASHSRLLKSLAPVLKTSWAKQLFAQYHHDAMLRSKRGNWRRALKRDVEFFIRIENEFDWAQDITAQLIVRRTGRAFVNRFRRAMSFLANCKLVDLKDPQYILEYKFQKLREISRANAEWIATVLEEFLDHLIQRANTKRRGHSRQRQASKPKSFESNIRAARSLLNIAQNAHNVRSLQGVNQETLNLIVGKRPGMRTALRSFVRFLNVNHRNINHLKILPAQVTPVPAHLIMPERKRVALLKSFASNESRFEMRWALMGVFNLVYAQMTHQSCSMTLDQIKRVDDGFHVCFARHWIELDPLFVPLLQRWLKVRREISAFEIAGASVYLFPGRQSGTHLHPTSGDVFRRRHGIAGRAGRTTALAGMIRGGLHQSRVLVDCFGLSMNRAQAYLNAFSVHNRRMARFVRDHYVAP